MMLNVGNPEQAFRWRMLPNDGVGLARMEFIFATGCKVHPLALTRFDAARRPATRAQIDDAHRAATRTRPSTSSTSSPQGIGDDLPPPSIRSR